MKVTIEVSVDKLKEYIRESSSHPCHEVLSFHEGTHITDCKCSQKKKKKGIYCHCPISFEMNSYPTEFKIIKIESSKVAQN